MLAVVVAIIGVVGALLSGGGHFQKDACASIEDYLAHEVVGQDFAIIQLTDAVCYHLSRIDPPKPLVVSVHGPPGVGKTLTHRLLARSLYNRHPNARLQCPGKDCKGYKVFYGMDYLVREQDERLKQLQEGLISHLQSVADPLVVVEEYDKLDCAARGLWRQLLQHPEHANVTWGRAIILLESNLGMFVLEDLTSTSQGRDKVTSHGTDALMRDLVFDKWREDACEAIEDTMKMVSLVDVFLPYLPLEPAHLRELVVRGLQQRASELQQQKHVSLVWGSDVLDFLQGKVEANGALDGAKSVDAVLTSYLSRILRRINVTHPESVLEYRLAANGDGVHGQLEHIGY